MNDYAYYNGIFTPYDACCIPLSDRSIFFGDAVYDVAIGRNRTPYQLDIHLDRLLKNARCIGLESIPEKQELKQIADELISLSGSDEFMLYFQLSGASRRRSHLRINKDTNVLATITKAEIPRKAEYISAITRSDVRHGYCNVKTTNLFPAILSVADAELHGSETAIFHKNGFVTECSSANVSILKNGLLITHPLDNSILPGISQENMKRICNQLGIGVAVRDFTIDEIMSSDAVLVTSTTKLLKVCNSINGRSLKCKCMDVVNDIFEAMLYDLSKETT